MIPAWRVEPEWKGERCFIICGGPSVLKVDLNLLRGQKVIAVNSSYIAAPFADFVIFADGRWHTVHCRQLEQFKGRIVSCSRTARGPKVLRLERRNPPGLCDNPSQVTVQKTSASAAIGLAVHLGCSSIVLLGLDGKHGSDGRTHHHVPHQWVSRSDYFRQHRAELTTLVEPLKAKGIECLLATPDSAYADLWPTVELMSLLPQKETMAA